MPALCVMIALTAAIVGFSGFSSFYLLGRLQFIGLLFGIPIALMIQSSFVIARVRRSFRRRGWLVRAV